LPPHFSAKKREQRDEKEAELKKMKRIEEENEKIRHGLGENKERKRRKLGRPKRKEEDQAVKGERPVKDRKNKRRKEIKRKEKWEGKRPKCHRPKFKPSPFFKIAKYTLQIQLQKPKAQVNLLWTPAAVPRPNAQSDLGSQFTPRPKLCRSTDLGFIVHYSQAQSELGSLKSKAQLKWAPATSKCRI
jgi:hypothetical protein